MKNPLSKSIRLILLISLFIGVNFTFAQSSRFSKEKYINGKGDTLNYRMLFPDYNLARQYPLVIFLHGSGERGNDNEAQLKWGVMNFATDQNMVLHPALVVVPQCPAGLDWADFRENGKIRELRINASPSKPMQLVIELIYKLSKTMPVDTNRIYITGLSMGGYGTYDAITRYPHLFAAAVPVCGGGDASKAPSIAHIPIWIFHGSEDPAVNPNYSLDMAEALIKSGAHPGFTQYPSTGHFSWLAAYSDPFMLEWMFQQHK